MKKSILFIAVALALTACDDRQQASAPPQYVAPQAVAPGQAVAPQTVVVQQPQQSSHTGDLLTGAALGAIATHLFSGGSRQAAPAPAPTVSTTKIIERHTVVNRYVERPTVASKQAPVAKSPSYGSVYAQKPTSSSAFKPSYVSSRSSGKR